jgi:hypothetical protein
MSPHFVAASGLRQSNLSGESLGMFLDGETVAGAMIGRAAQAIVLMRFQPSTPERLAQLQKEDTDRETRLLDLIRPGASFEGTAQNANAASASLRLRFVKVENRGDAVEAVLESGQHPETGWLLKGKLHLAEGMLRFTTNGASRPGVSIFSGPESILPYFNMWNSDLSLFIEKDRLTGYCGPSQNSKLTFPLVK